MGAALSIGRIFSDLIVGPREVRMLMVGLDAAGKTTILYKLKLGDLIQSVPTIGFNLETVEYQNVKFTVWDIGGQDRLRLLWRHYYSGTDGIIFVVDSADRDRLPVAKEELRRLLSERELADARLLLFANKQDLPRALSTAQLSQELGLRELAKGREWYIQGTCAVSGAGLYEGLDWLAAACRRRG
eukprot:TRINITY_DN1813_c0_g2_i14.p3 TRINITY_DN1813_c0_g2~~TRINITY_DN1813_c0_g2_i14.p3  ORF type:complete len:213 (+),score=100.09 TRINITY_DN1813_c0_g2_i14:84-641(+)